jgi:glycosyltransferase involved in cell wall biosynthesis
VSEGEHANGWLVDDADRDGLVSALAMAAADAPERRRRGDNAARMVRERYSWSSVAETYHDIYDDALFKAGSQSDPT